MRPSPERAAAQKSGLVRYFTGVPCKRGHVAERLVSTKGCTECHKINVARWNAANTERVKDIKHKSRAKSPVAVRASKAAWRRSNREAVLQHKRSYYIRHREKVAAKNAAWVRRNPLAARRIKASWEKRHPEAVKAIRQRIRAVRSSAPGSFSAAEIARLHNMQGGICALCLLAPLTAYHVDHIIPLARGGSNWIENIQLTCPPCNLRKGAKVPNSELTNAA